MIDPLAPDVLARLEALVYDDDARLNGAEWGCNVRRSQLAALLAVARDHARLTEEVRTLRLLVAVNEASAVPDVTVDDLGAYIDLALIQWVPDDMGLARHIAESIHPRLVPSPPPGEPDEGEQRTAAGEGKGVDPEPPVPLDEIKQRRTSYSTRGGVTIAGFTPEERDALCEALRIAVEACERVAALEATADPVAAVTKDRPDHAFALGMAKAYAKHALAAVRELVDLGGDDG